MVNYVQVVHELSMEVTCTIYDYTLEMLFAHIIIPIKRFSFPVTLIDFLYYSVESSEFESIKLDTIQVQNID